MVHAAIPVLLSDELRGGTAHVSSRPYLVGEATYVCLAPPLPEGFFWFCFFFFFFFPFGIFSGVLSYSLSPLQVFQDLEF